MPTISRTPHGVRGLKFFTIVNVSACLASHPSRGAWIEIPRTTGWRGVSVSHPSRGAWIEILASARRRACFASRTPHGVRGLKSGLPLLRRNGRGRRTPHGVRGLKFAGVPRRCRRGWSHPSRGAWIEINAWNAVKNGVSSHPSRGAWIEIPAIGVRLGTVSSRTPHGVRGLKSEHTGRLERL